MAPARLPDDFLDRLSAKESNLLRALVDANGEVVPRPKLNAELGPISARTLDTYIKQIRAKMRSAGLDAGLLRTHTGQGYSLRNSE